MKPIRDKTQTELGAYVQSHFGAKGIDVILSGGAVVAIYTKGRYVSDDLDLVNRFLAKRSVIKSAIKELGF
jgi:predicted nucleotidyltransferase